jgi:hypothetical protein
VGDDRDAGIARRVPGQDLAAAVVRGVVDRDHLEVGEGLVEHESRPCARYSSTR